MDTDVVIVGAGIAGVSLAAELAPRRRVVVLEQEHAPGYHATGRSAALLAPNYGGALLAALTAASEKHLRRPPAGFAEHPLLRPQPILFFGRNDQVSQLDAIAKELRATDVLCERLSAAQAAHFAPVFRDDYLGGGVLMPGSASIDVDALLQGYARIARANGAQFRLNARLERGERSRGVWRLQTSNGPLTASLLVNAAGAWADVVAEACDVAPLGFTPLRRTGVIVDAPETWPIRALPACIDVTEDFYFKPDAGRIMVSPADETLSPPTDAAADDYDVAVAINRLTDACKIDVRRVRSTWAGLRTFSPDRNPVAGHSCGGDGFFWLAGQGGAGVQTAPALARIAAALICDTEPELAPGPLSPLRFRTSSQAREASAS